MDRFEREVRARPGFGDPRDPWTWYLALRRPGHSALLDAPGSGHPWERRAYVLPEPLERIAAAGGGDPWLRVGGRMRRSLPPVQGAGTRFRGGAVGWFAYDVARRFERLPARARADSSVPEAFFTLHDHGLEIDVATGRALFFARPSPRLSSRRAMEERAATLERELRAAAEPRLGDVPETGALTSPFDRRGYERAVAAVREGILEGEVYQVNLAQRFLASFRGDPAHVYARLRRLSPAPFAHFFEAGEVAVLGSSPELFLARTGERVVTRPIKGTRRRTGDPERDAALRRDLERSPKDRRELAMIVDLERNDLGRVARYGSVRVEQPGVTEAFAAVFHRTAQVSASVPGEVGTGALLRAAFPSGSVTGAPKIAAMAWIDRLEPVRRGVFTGAAGWIAPEGEMVLDVAIRTVVREGGRIHFHVGGGVVLDSDPTEEYRETLVKGDAMARALGAPPLLE